MTYSERKKQKYIKTIAPVVCATALYQTFVATKEPLNFSNSVILAGFFLLCFVVFKQPVAKYTRAERLQMGAFSFVLTFILRIGACLVQTGYYFAVNWTPLSFLKELYVLAGLFWLCLRLIYMSSRLLSKEMAFQETWNWKLFWLGMGLIFFCGFLPHLITFYPGVTTPDSIQQWRQVIGEMNYYNHHPFIHTLFIWFSHSVVSVFTDSANAVLAFYCILQMLMNAAIFSYAVVWTYCHGVPKKIVYLLFICYAFVPIHGSFSIIMWKDILFGSIMVLYVISLYDLIRDMNNHVLNVMHCIKFLLTSCYVGLGRGNGYYIVLFLIPFAILALLLCRSKNIFAYALPIAAFLLVVVIKGPVYTHAGIGGTNFVEALSIPIQQVSRVIVEGGELNESDLQTLEDLLDPNTLEDIKEQYLPYISDPMKNLIKSNISKIESNPSIYLKLWLNGMMKNPCVYLDAYFNQVYGFLYPTVNYKIESEGNSGEDYGIIRNHTISPNTPVRVYKEWTKQFPIINLIWGIGFHFILTMYAALICCMKKKYILLLVFIPIVGLALSLLISTPVFAEARYAYAYYTCAPILCMVPFLSNKSKS